MPHRNPEGDYLDGFTIFKVDGDGRPEDWLLDHLRTIDLHRGEYSHDPPWSVINVIGTPWSDNIRSALSQLGFAEHEDTAGGFIAKKTDAG